MIMKTQYITVVCLFALLLVPNYIGGQSKSKGDKVRVTYTYDAAGNRIKRVVTTTQSGIIGRDLDLLIADSLQGRIVIIRPDIGKKDNGGNPGKDPGSSSGSHDRFIGAELEEVINLP